MRVANDFTIPATTVVVRGCKRVALVNVKRQTLVRLSNDLWDAVLSSGAGRARTAAERLVASGYLEPQNEASIEAPLDRSSVLCLTPPAKSLVISDHLSGDQHALEVVREFVHGGHTSHIVVIHPREAGGARLGKAFLPSLKIPFEVGFIHGEHLETEIFTSLGKRAGRRLARTRATSPIGDRLRLSYRGILVNTLKYEGYGFLYVDGDGTVWPDWLEPRFHYGSISEFGSRGKPSEDHRTFAEYSTNNKSLRDVCNVCELRVCCIWSASRRVDPDDIKSAPHNCGYDPASEDFQNEKF